MSSRRQWWCGDGRPEMGGRWMVTGCTLRWWFKGFAAQLRFLMWDDLFVLFFYFFCVKSNVKGKRKKRAKRQQLKSICFNTKFDVGCS